MSNCLDWSANRRKAASESSLCLSTRPLNWRMFESKRPSTPGSFPTSWLLIPLPPWNVSTQVTVECGRNRKKKIVERPSHEPISKILAGLRLWARRILCHSGKFLDVQSLVNDLPRNHGLNLIL